MIYSFSFYSLFYQIACHGTFVDILSETGGSSDDMGEIDATATDEATGVI
jgi:hypothetical protein